MSPVVIEVDTLAQASRGLLRAPAAASTATAAESAEWRSICPDPAHVTNPSLGCVRLPGCQQVIVLHVAGKVRLGNVLEQRGGFRHRGDGIGEAGNHARSLG